MEADITIVARQASPNSGKRAHPKVEQRPVGARQPCWEECKCFDKFVMLHHDAVSVASRRHIPHLQSGAPTDIGSQCLRSTGCPFSPVAPSKVLGLRCR